MVATLPAHDNWVCALAVSPLPAAASSSLVVAVTAAGSVRISSLDASADSERVIKRARLGVGPRVTGAALSPSGSALLLLRGDTLYVYALDDLRMLAAAAAPTSGDAWSGAAFVAEGALLAWTRAGHIVRYTLATPTALPSVTPPTPAPAAPPALSPTPSSPGVSSASPMAPARTASPAISARPATPAPATQTPAAPAQSAAFGLLTDDVPRLACSAVLRAAPASPPFAALAHAAAGTFVVAVDAAADLTFWAAAPSLPADAPSPSPSPSPSASASVEAPAGRAAFKSGWPSETSDRVTACIALDSSLLIVRGHASGLISASPLAEFTDRKERAFTPWAAHAGPVTALAALSLPRSPLSLLASAGADCLVKVWDLACVLCCTVQCGLCACVHCVNECCMRSVSCMRVLCLCFARVCLLCVCRCVCICISRSRHLRTRECVATFSEHCMPVTHLLQPPELALEGTSPSCACGCVYVCAAVNVCMFVCVWFACVDFRLLYLCE